MEWGIFLVTSLPPGTSATVVIQNSIAYAVRAEELNYDHAWVLEHHFTRYGLVGSPILQAGYVLGRTKRLRVGTAIQVIGLDHPVRLAEQVSLLDQMSEGRLMFGFGRGMWRKDFAVFGRDIGRSREYMEEWYAIMKSAWVTGRCSAQSDNLNFSEVKIYPRPYTKPHPPLYTVAQSPESLRWAGKQGIPVIFDRFTHAFERTHKDLIAALDIYNEAAQKAGHDPTQIPHALSLLAGVSADGEKIKKVARPFIGWWIEEGRRTSELTNRTGYEHHQAIRDRLASAGIRTGYDVADGIVENSPIGSVQECVDKIANVIEATGITRLALGFETVGDRSAVLECMQMYSEEVIPRVEAASVSKAVA